MSSRNIYVVWALLTLPALWITFAYISQRMTYGEALAISGSLSVQLLIATLVITPLSRLKPRHVMVRALIKWRRAIGVAVFGYAFLHVFIYVVRKSDLMKIWTEGVQPDLLTGWIAFVIFTLLAITSRNSSVRALGNKWKTLHRWTYPAALLVAGHWILTAFDPTQGIIHAVIIVSLLLVRLVPKNR